MRNALKARHYLACIEGESQPVAVATMYYIPDQSIVTLQGAATLEAFRGKGIYSALLARRLDDARGDGMETAVSHANPNTSAPILARLGFEKVLDLVLYGYPPKEATTH
jgi:N-acetylglutamate synthase-like GNAT family acetyltransferase